MYQGALITQCAAFPFLWHVAACADGLEGPDRWVMGDGWHWNDLMS